MEYKTSKSTISLTPTTRQGYPVVKVRVNNLDVGFIGLIELSDFTMDALVHTEASPENAGLVRRRNHALNYMCIEIEKTEDPNYRLNIIRDQLGKLSTDLDETITLEDIRQNLYQLYAVIYGILNLIRENNHA